MCVKEIYPPARRDDVKGTKNIGTGRKSPVLKTIGEPQSRQEGSGAEKNLLDFEPEA